MTYFLPFIPAAYLAGSINFAIILFKLLGKEDPRDSFSGNAGATNVYRLAGVYWAIIVLLLDVGRAVGIAMAALFYLPLEFVSWIALSLVVGNRFPCFHGFKGGKGVANFLGYSAVIAPVAAGISALAWVVAYLLFRKSFIGSFFMVSVLGAGIILATGLTPIALSGVVAVVLFIFVNHKKNVLELVQAPSLD